MKLGLGNINLRRAHPLFRDEEYPGKLLAADLAAAEKLINQCGYHGRDPELADAKRATLG